MLGMFSFENDENVYKCIVPLLEAIVCYEKFWDEQFVDNIVDTIVRLGELEILGDGECELPYTTILYKALLRRNGQLRHPLEKYLHILEGMYPEPYGIELILCIAKNPANINNNGYKWVALLSNIVENSKLGPLESYDVVFDYLLRKLDANVQPIMEEFETCTDEVQFYMQYLVYYYAKRYKLHPIDPPHGFLRALQTCDTDTDQDREYAWCQLLLLLEYPDMVTNKQQIVEDLFAIACVVYSTFSVPCFCAITNCLQWNLPYVKTNSKYFFYAFKHIPEAAQLEGYEAMRLLKSKCTHQEWLQMVARCSKDVQQVVLLYSKPGALFAEISHQFTDTILMFKK